MKIHSASPLHTRTTPALIAANYNGVKAEFFPVAMAKGDHKSPEYTTKFPNGRIPAAELDDGTCIDQSTAILRAVMRAGPDVGLYGTNPSEMAQVDMWIDFAAQDLYANASVWIYPILGYGKFDAAVTEAAKVKVAGNLAILNKHLEARTYMVGERITAADLILGVYCGVGFSMVFDAEYRKPFPHVVRWYETVAHQPEFVDVQPWKPMCDKMAVYGEK